MDKIQLKKALAEVAKTAGIDNSGKSAFAELVMEVLEPQHLSLQLFSAFMDVVTRNPGDELGRRVQRGRYPIQTMAPGADHNAHMTAYQEQMVRVFDRIITGFQDSLWNVRSGDVGTLEKIRADLKADLFDEVVARVFTLLTTVWNATDTPNNYTDASSTGITATVLDNMIENVLEFSPNVRAIVGARRALLPVYSFAQYKEFALSGTNTDAVAFPTAAFLEYTNSTKVSTYKGISLIEIPQVFRQKLPNIRDRMIPTDRVLVIGESVGEIEIMGGTEYQEAVDLNTQPGSYRLHAWQAFGMIIDNVEGIGVIKTNT